MATHINLHTHTQTYTQTPGKEVDDGQAMGSSRRMGTVDGRLRRGKGGRREHRGRRVDVVAANGIHIQKAEVKQCSTTKP